MTRQTVCKTFLILMVLSLLVGCEDDQHKQVAIVATQAAERQASQNKEMARVNREVAEGTRRMVEADAEARKEIVSVHHELQKERADLTSGFDSLESERKQIAGQRRTESMLVPAAKLLGGACLAIAVLMFCTALIQGRHRDDAVAAELNELLIHDLVCDQPQLLSLRDTMPRIENKSPPEEGKPARLTSNPRET